MNNTDETIRLSKWQVVIGVLAIIVACGAIVVALLTPEIRYWLGIGRPQSGSTSTLSSSVVTGATTSGKNLISNPSFEFGNSNPFNWTPDYFTNGKLIWENGVAHSGSRSISKGLHCTQGLMYVRWLSDDFSVQPGAQYLLAVWVKSQLPWVDTGGQAQVAVDVAQGSIYRNSFSPTVTWERKEWKITIPSDKIVAHIGLGYLGSQCDNISNKVYYDDVEFSLVQ